MTETAPFRLTETPLLGFRLPDYNSQSNSSHDFMSLSGGSIYVYEEKLNIRLQSEFTNPKEKIRNGWAHTDPTQSPRDGSDRSDRSC